MRNHQIYYKVIKTSTSEVNNTVFTSILDKMGIDAGVIECDLELVSLFKDKVEALYYFDVINRYNNLLNLVRSYIERQSTALIETFKR
eukprot:UN07375